MSEPLTDEDLAMLEARFLRDKDVHAVALVAEVRRLRTELEQERAARYAEAVARVVPYPCCGIMRKTQP